MDEIKKNLNEAYHMISSILVQGEAVDIMAAARAKLRKVYAALDKEEKEVKSDG